MAQVAAETVLKRHGYRTEPMEVLCLSMGRSGTTSFTAALEILGYKVYHGWTIFDDAPGRRRWIKALRSKYFGHGHSAPLTKSDFDWLLGSYSATGGDFPCVAFADELIAAYPDAKVVIVERDAEAWRRSLVEVIGIAFNPINYYLLAFLDPWFMGEVENLFGIAYTGFFKKQNPQEILEVAADRYRAYYNHIREIVPMERLLDFQLTQGWKPLCEFLGKDLPQQPFPWLNEKGEVKKAEAKYQRRATRNMAVNATVVLAICFVLRWIYLMF